MLVITRRVGEIVVIGSPPEKGEEERVVRVVVLGARGAAVKVGIDAPQDIVVLREELATSVGKPK